MKRLSASLFFVALVVLASCKKEEPAPVGETFTFTPDTPDLQAAVQEALINMNDNDIIHFSEGTFTFSTTLSLDSKNNITIEGEGRDKTILDFSGQGNGGTGAQGMQITNVTQLLLKDFTIQDADGDNIKVKDSDGVSMINLAVVYTGPAGPDNGAYALYPVTSKNVYIHNCYVRGASDAGIYVGQSQQVIVSGNEVTECVAGIEIENCVSSDVFDNKVYNNTGGILVFDLPGLPVIENGMLTRVFNNTITDNNHDNFAPEGNMVGIVPPGSGLMLLASREIEVFGNTFTDNNLMPMSMFSYTIISLGGDPIDLPATYDPNLQKVYVHDNTFTPVNKPFNPDQTDFGLALQQAYSMHPDLDLFNDMPDVIWGGITDPNNTGSLTHDICIKNNGDMRFVNLKAATAFQLLNDDVTPHDCTREPLPAVTVNARQ